jgi:radical SAM protein with 4Fe4S-binding SPASM domain
VSPKINLSSHCRWLYFCPVINWDGAVSPCCFDKNAEIDLGNVFNDGGLKNIWKSTKYKAFRKRLRIDRKSIDICGNCSEGLEVDIVAKERIKS